MLHTQTREIQVTEPKEELQGHLSTLKPAQTQRSLKQETSEYKVCFTILTDSHHLQLFFHTSFLLLKSPASILQLRIQIWDIFSCLCPQAVLIRPFPSSKHSNFPANTELGMWVPIFTRLYHGNSNRKRKFVWLILKASSLMSCHFCHVAAEQQKDWPM